MVCEYCGREIDESNWRIATVTGGVICATCYSAHYWSCTKCGRAYSADTANNLTLCPGCSEHYWRCGTCGKFYQLIVDLRTPVIAGSAGDTVEVCETCLTNLEMVRTCDVCRSRYTPLAPTSAQRYEHNYCPVCHDVNGWDECTECHESARYLEGTLCAACRATPRLSSGIREHSYVPDPLQFHQTTGEDLQCNPYLGFELEVDCASPHRDRDSVAAGVCHDGFSWCKHDGSLDNGFEMVSHPMTLNYHKVYPWPEKLHYLLQQNMQSRSNSNCAMHVHVNRDFLSEQQWCGLDDWVSEYQSFVIAVAQRHSVEYAKFHSDMHEDLLDATRNGEYRYAAVNFENDNTIEFRVFRGTLSPPMFYANLEFVDALVRMFKFDGVQPADRFVNFVNAQSRRYAELASFIEIRKIGVKNA